MNPSANVGELLACPCCGSALSPPAELACSGCGQNFFSLHGMPCLFSNGEQQRAYWAHLAAVVAAEAEQASPPMPAFNFGLPPSSSARAATLTAAQRDIKRCIVQLLRSAGIEPRRADAEFGERSHQSLLQYFPLLLRDWAWPAARGLGTDWDENKVALDGVIQALPEAGLAGKRLLVLGSGAGRLSWDVHCAAVPDVTVALDFNPLLSYAAHSLIGQGASLELPDAQLQPGHGAARLQRFTARASGGSGERRASFVQICGDAFQAPLLPASFDYVLTPWFLDICGRDARRVIGVVANLLRPGGQWLNYGPLLYPETLPSALRYNPDELRELLMLAGFDLEWEREQDCLYLQSPLARRGRWERSWLWRARAPSAPALAPPPITAPLARNPLPTWWVLPHLAAPALAPELLPPELRNLAQLFDGGRSLNELSQQLAPLLPAGHDAEQFLRELMLAYVFAPGGGQPGTEIP